MFFFLERWSGAIPLNFAFSIYTHAISNPNSNNNNNRSNHLSCRESKPNL